MGFGGILGGIVNAVSSIGSLLVKGAQALVGAVGQVLTFATSLLTSRAFAAPTTDTTNTTGVTNNARIQAQPNTTTPIPVVYGDAFLGGKFVDACLTTDGQNMFYVMAISGISNAGQFNYDLTKIYYGDRICTFDSTNHTKVVSLTDNAGNVDTKINGKLYINLYVSDSGGNVTPMNGAPLPWASGTSTSMGSGSGLSSAQQWASTNRRMNGLAFAIIKLTYSSDAGTTQLSPVTFKCTQYLNNQGCAKPGDVWYDYMTNGIYGCAVDPAYVDANTAYDLNVYSDEYITFNNYNGGTASQPRYRINGVINTSQNVLQNVDQIMVACDSWMQYNAVSGKWAVVINKAQAPAIAFNDDNIIGSIKVNSVDITQTPNQIQAKFPDSTNRDQYNYVNESVPPYLLFANEPVNKISLTYELVNNSVQALYLANRFLEQNREDLLVTINTTYEGIQTNAGDVISITNAAYGWNAKLFRATVVKESVNEDKTLGATIQLMEYNTAVYDDKDITEYVPAGNSGLVSSNYFSTLDMPVVIDQQPNAPVPSFGVRVTIPDTGRVTYISLYYTTSSSPSNTDWQVYDTQDLPNSQPFSNGSYFVFSHISLPTDNYYFAYKVGNDVAQSNLSVTSNAYNWLPNPASSSVAGVFLGTFSPSVLQVPYDQTPSFTGVVAGLYGTVAGGSVDFVASQNDSDAAFVNNSWRIGGSSTTGYGDIVASGITIGQPSDGGTYASFPPPTAMSSNPATLSVPVRYKNSNGVVSQGATAVLQYTFNYKGSTGSAGIKVSTAHLYQWSTVTPTSPNGIATFTWATNATSGYTGGNGWSTSIPTNPGTPGILLWQSSKPVSAPGPDLTTVVDFTTGTSTASVSANGLNGLQTAAPTVYQWAITAPTSPTGTSTYTWASGAFSPIPSGWSLAPPNAPSAGYTLYGATVSLLDSAAAVTSEINWTLATISARGYAGTNGTSGQAGASSRICYSKTNLTSLSSSPATYQTTGNATFPPNGTWGIDTVWSATPPSLSAGNSLYQSDGIYDATTNLTTWNSPYLSSLKVGSLSAITANTGSLTVTGTFSSANGNFSVDASGNTVIRNATTGARLELTNTKIQVFDSNGALRVLIGKLN